MTTKMDKSARDGRQQSFAGLYDRLQNAFRQEIASLRIDVEPQLLFAFSECE